MKYLTPQEIVSLGILQELNRRELHPRGLALEIECENDGTPLRIIDIQDHRDEIDGVAFINIDVDKVKTYEELSKAEDRYATLGYVVQPLDSEVVNHLYPYWIMIYTRRDGEKIVFESPTLSRLRDEWNDKQKPNCIIELIDNDIPVHCIEGDAVYLLFSTL